MNRRKLAEQIAQDEHARRRAALLARVEGCPSEWRLQEGPAGYSLRARRIVAGIGLVTVHWTEPGYALMYTSSTRIDLRGPYYDWHDIELAIEAGVHYVQVRPKRRPPNKSRRTGSLVCRLAP